jgi:hypothetical protein
MVNSDIYLSIYLSNLFKYISYLPLGSGIILSKQDRIVLSKQDRIVLSKQDRKNICYSKAISSNYNTSDYRYLFIYLSF